MVKRELTEIEETLKLTKKIKSYSDKYYPEETKKFEVDSGRITTDRELISDWVVRGMATSSERSRDGRLWASDAGLCEKRAVLNATKPTSISIATAVNNTYFSFGIEIERLVLDSLFKMDKLLYKDYRIPDIGLNLGGKVDGITLVGGKVRILEVKSCGAMPSKTKPTHAAQAAVYAAVTGLPATVLYFSRHVAKFGGRLMIDEFDLEENEEKTKEIILRIAYSNLAIQEQVIPNKTLSLKNKTACGFCDYIPDCWGEDSVDYHYPGVTPRQHLELLEESNEIAERLLDPEEIKRRRNGVLNFIKTHGNDYAKEALTHTEWSKLY